MDERYKKILASMGLSVTQIYGPTDIDSPEVQKRMREVADKATRAPSVFNQQNDFDLGNQVRMLTRNDSAHEVVLCAARDRIFQLSLRVAELEAILNLSLTPDEVETLLALRSGRAIVMPKQ